MVDDVSTTPVTCMGECSHYAASWSITGDTNKTEKCLFDDKAGVAQVGTVVKVGDCPWFNRQKTGIDGSEVYPIIKLKESGDTDFTIDTESDLRGTIDSFREVKLRHPERFHRLGRIRRGLRNFRGRHR